jgi:hypothetical protein
LETMRKLDNYILGVYYEFERVKLTFP